jgi:hypothetical protein
MHFQSKPSDDGTRTERTSLVKLREEGVIRPYFETLMR